MSEQPVTASADIREFERALIRYKMETGKGWAEVLKMQARLLVERLIEWTPPFGIRKDAQKRGKDSLARDIRRVFVPVKELPVLIKDIAGARIERLMEEKDFGKVRFRNPGIQKAWEARDWDALQVIFRRAETARWRDIKVLRVPDPALHHAARVNGGVPKSRKAVAAVERAASLNAYIREVQKRVGSAKAGWIASAVHLSAKFPAWIGKSGAGTVRDDSGNPSDPAITMTNAIRFVSDIFPEDKRAELLATRVRDMARHAEIMLEARARKVGLQ